MNALFACVQRIGDGRRRETAYRPWFGNSVSYSMGGFGAYLLGNIFAESRSALDAIAADPRTEFVIPIEVTGKKLGWKDKDADLPANTHGKITSWIARTGLHKLDPDMKKPGQIAKHIMAQVSGVEGVDPLNGFRVHWPEEIPTVGVFSVMGEKAISLRDRINIWGAGVNARFEIWLKGIADRIKSLWRKAKRKK